MQPKINRINKPFFFKARQNKTKTQRRGSQEVYETAYIQVRFFPVAQSVCLQCGRPGFDPWVGKIPWGRKWQPTPIRLPGKFHGWRSLVGYNPWGPKESDTTEQLHWQPGWYASEGTIQQRSGRAAGSLHHQTWAPSSKSSHLLWVCFTC